MADLYSIVDWDQHFENNRSRDLKDLAWVPVPNKMGGDGYTELLDHPNGAAHFGAWITIIEIASRCRPRGTLLRGTSEPHDLRSLSRLSRVPISVYEEAIPRLIKLGWLRRNPYTSQEVTSTGKNEISTPHPSATIPHPPAVPSFPFSSFPFQEDNKEVSKKTKKKTKEKKPPKTQPEDGPVLAPEPEATAGIEPPSLRRSAEDWLAYKTERREGYKPQGLKQFLSRIQNLASEHGHQKVTAALERAMANGWIGFDHDLKGGNGPTNDDPFGVRTGAARFLERRQRNGES